MRVWDSDLLRKHDGIYKNEPVASTYLCRGTPNTLAGYILYSDKVLFQLWGHLENAIRQGGPQWTRSFPPGRGIFDHFFRTDADTQNFLQGMHGFGLIEFVSGGVCLRSLALLNVR